MKAIKLNRNALIYFFASWILPVILIVSGLLANNEAYLYLLFFVTTINVFVNFLIIVFLGMMHYTFTENRKEFLHSLILLFFNFPFVAGYLLILMIL